MTPYNAAADNKSKITRSDIFLFGGSYLQRWDLPTPEFIPLCVGGWKWISRDNLCFSMTFLLPKVSVIESFTAEDEQLCTSTDTTTLDGVLKIVIKAPAVNDAKWVFISARFKCHNRRASLPPWRVIIYELPPSTAVILVSFSSQSHSHLSLFCLDGVNNSSKHKQGGWRCTIHLLMPLALAKVFRFFSCWFWEIKINDSIICKWQNDKTHRHLVPNFDLWPVRVFYWWIISLLLGAVSNLFTPYVALSERS